LQLIFSNYSYVEVLNLISKNTVRSDIDFAKGEVILINKPSDWTSFDVVNKIRYRIDAKKVGHAGTLDPLATGLLIVCTGKYTKRIAEFQCMEKEYVGTLIFGAETPSYDSESEITKTYDIKNITEDDVLKKVGDFVGEIEQFPPPYSAVKVNGQRAYKRARKGEEFQTRSRKVDVKSFEVSKIELPTVEFKVVCSTGTYIRSLVHDLGKSFNNGAYMTALCRTRIGQYQLDDALTIDEFVKLADEIKMVSLS